MGNDMGALGKKATALTFTIFGGAIVVQLAQSIIVVRKQPPCGNYGDIDGDGFVTSADADLAVKYYTGLVSLTPEQLARADVNGDGRVTPADAMLISQYVNGLINTFPVCGN